jgi:hypothetical protein
VGRGRERDLGLSTQATASGSESAVAGGRSGEGRPVVGEACASEWGPCHAEDAEGGGYCFKSRNA